MNGSEQRTCQDTGDWDGVAPTCECEQTAYTRYECLCNGNYSCLLKYLILEEKGCLHRGNPIEVLPYNETDKKGKIYIPQGKESEKEGTEVQ